MFCAILKRATALTAILFMSTQISPTTACSTCVYLGEPFQLSHPHAVRIAVATRKSIDSGLLPAAKSRRFETLDAALIRVAYHQIRATLSNDGNPVRIDVLVVDEPALYRLELRGNLVRVAPLSGGQHRPADARLITTSPVVRALGRFDLAISKAVENGLLEIEGEPSVVLGAGYLDTRLPGLSRSPAGDPVSANGRGHSRSNSEGENSIKND